MYTTHFLRSYIARICLYVRVIVLSIYRGSSGWSESVLSAECCCRMCCTVCLKCDARLQEQTDGSVLHRDIAHQRETLAVALQKLAEVLEEGRKGHASTIRLIVGRGVIRDEVMRQLSWLALKGEILSVDHDDGNTGALLVVLRRSRR